MTPQQFIAKWKAADLSERSAYQQHFLDLCELLGQPKPAEVDPEGSWFTFERGVEKTDGGKGFADVWLQSKFGWEYKGKHKNLAAAYQQLLKYREALENPPLLVVCDLDRFQIHTNFTDTVKRVHEFDLDGLADPANLLLLRRVFTEPDALRPDKTRSAVTEEVAGRFARLADGLAGRGVPADRAAPFLMKLIFCMFAEDVDLLPRDLFARTIANARGDAARLSKLLRNLFEAMAKGEPFGADDIAWFNGGLFADAEVIDLTRAEIDQLLEASRCDWSSVEPSIFGTLFERTLDPAKRSQIGAHYTSREDIETLLRPVLLAPLRREWEEARARADKLWAKVQADARAASARRRTDSKTEREFRGCVEAFSERLRHVTVLDPACGSGNFLYVAVHLLLDLEKEVLTYLEERYFRPIPLVTPTQLRGLEINAYAQQLAQVVLWIGYLQWKHFNGYQPKLDPVLDTFENIRHADAVLDLSDPANPREPEWPEAEFIVGNPPFLGDKKMRGELGDAYVKALRSVYKERLPGQSDLCCYWFEKARAQIQRGACRRAGLLATQGIRGGANRTVLDRIKQTGSIFWAYSDRDWILDGATVHVSMVGFDDGKDESRTLNGKSVAVIHGNLAAGDKEGESITGARPLLENSELCFLGVMKSGPFDIGETLALKMAAAPNPHGRPSSDVLRPRLTARDLLQRSEIGWIIDFGLGGDAEQACLYEAPWKYLSEMVKPKRSANRRDDLATRWWLYARPRPALRRALENAHRFIVTPEVSKHRIFAWLDAVYLADHQTRAFPRTDDYFFGVLHSRVHETWARAQGTQLRDRESGFRYTPTSCFETFPFPDPSPSQRDAVAAAAKDLDALRNTWLNPPEWTRMEVLEFPGSAGGPWRRYLHDPDQRGVGVVRFPRLVARDAESAEKLKRRTLTNLYNEMPTWLKNAHRRIDEAVFAAYGWPADLADDALLARLLERNLSRAGVSES